MSRISFIALAGALAFAALPALADSTPPVTAATPSVTVGSDSKTNVQTAAKASTMTDSKDKVGAQIGKDKDKSKLPQQTVQHPVPAPKADTSVKTDTTTSTSK